MGNIRQITSFVVQLQRSTVLIASESVNGVMSYTGVGNLYFINDHLDIYNFTHGPNRIASLTVRPLQIGQN